MTLLNTNAATLVAAATNVDLTSAGSSAEMKSTVDTATQVAAAMAQLELELDDMAQDLIDSQDQLLALYEMNRSTRLNADLHDTLQMMAQQAQRLLRVDCAFVALTMPDHDLQFVQVPDGFVDFEQFTCICDESNNATQEWQLDPETHNAIFGIAIKNGYMRRFGIRAGVCAILGALNKKNGAFRSPDIKLARSIADRAASSIETALLVQDNLSQARLQTEIALAQRIQAELLPKSTILPDQIQLSVLSVPAREVGGDFYDMQALPDRPFAFYEGDVSGKGLSAAMLMAVTRTAIRTHHRYIYDPQPATILDRANYDLYGDFTDVGMFATVFYGQYLPLSNEIVYANCGHSPVIYMPHDGEPQLLEADSPPIGVMDTTFCSTHRLRFALGDVLLVTSDGLNEAGAPNGELFGIERMIALLKQYHSNSAQVIRDALLAAVNDFSKGVRHDDQTVLVLKHI